MSPNPSAAIAYTDRVVVVFRGAKSAGMFLMVLAVAPNSLRGGLAVSRDPRALI